VLDADGRTGEPDIMNKVLVIGGYGGFGARLSHRLSARGWTVLVAGRNAGTARAFCKTVPNARPVTADRNAPLAQLLADLQPDLVIDAAGPFQGSGYQVVTACVAAGIPYVDLADSRDFVAGIGVHGASALKAGVTVIVGASSVPALSGAVLRHLTKGMEDVRAVDIAISASNRATAGPSVAAAVLSYAGKPIRLWRGRRWIQGYGWQMLRRQRFEVDGLTPLSRLTALADVPDHDIVPQSVRGRPATTFRAGPEFSIHVLGIWLLSWPVRWGWLASLSRLRALMLFLQRLTANLGSDRSAMCVEVRGVAGGQSVLRQWTLIADKGDGPEIPTMAAELIAQKIREGRVPPGARYAGDCLALADFEPLFGRLAIRQSVTEHRHLSLYRRILGQRFEILPPVVQQMHDIIGDAGASGTATVVRGSSMLAKLICGLMRFPPAGKTDLHVAFAERNGVETWTRSFDKHVFSSQLSQSGAMLVERFGPLRFYFDLETSEAGLQMILRRWSVVGVPLPLRLAPACTGTETADGSVFCFDVAIALPLVGPVVRYAGRLQSNGTD
jgi:hypothetical protein